MRTPQPMRRMRYLIGEAIRQSDITDAALISLTRGDSWLASGFLAGAPAVPADAFRFEISPTESAWWMDLVEMRNGWISVFRATLSTAPGPETVWIGPDLTPVVIQPRPARSVESAQAIIADS